MPDPAKTGQHQCWPRDVAATSADNASAPGSICTAETITTLPGRGRPARVNTVCPVCAAGSLSILTDFQVPTRELTSIRLNSQLRCITRPNAGAARVVWRTLQGLGVRGGRDDQAERGAPSAARLYLWRRVRTGRCRSSGAARRNRGAGPTQVLTIPGITPPEMIWRQCRRGAVRFCGLFVPPQAVWWRRAV